MSKAVIIRYTTAPAVYDGFGTITVGPAGTLDQKPLRQVAIETQHLDWQEMRYGSGMYPSFTAAQFQELQGMRWYQASPSPGDLTT